MVERAQGRTFYLVFFIFVLKRFREAEVLWRNERRIERDAGKWPFGDANHAAFFLPRTEGTDSPQFEAVLVHPAGRVSMVVNPPEKKLPQAGIVRRFL